MINEQELVEAIDRLREGEQVLGITAELICSKVRSSEPFIAIMMALLFEQSNVQQYFENEFNKIARYELREALRAKQEVSNGLL